MTKEEFKAARLELGYKTHQGLAKKLEVDTSTIQKIEAGTRNPSKALLFRFKNLMLIKGWLLKDNVLYLINLNKEVIKY